MQTAAGQEELAGADERSATSTLYIISAAASETAQAASAEHSQERQDAIRSEQTPSRQAPLEQGRTGRTSVMATLAAAGLPRAAQDSSLRLTQTAMEQLSSFVGKSDVCQQPVHHKGAIENWRIEVAQELEREKTKRASIGESIAQAVQDVSELFLGSRKSARVSGSHICGSFWS